MKLTNKFVFSSLLFLWLFSLQNVHAQPLNWDYTNIIDDIQQSGANPDMVIGANGDIHVSFWNKNSDNLMYAKRNKSNAQWSFTQVDPLTSGYKSALTLDNNGKVHIAYLRNENGTAYISYANNVNGSWVIEQATTPVDTPDASLGPYGMDNYYPEYRQPSIDIELRADGTPFISTFDGTITNNLVQCGGVGFTVYRLRPQLIFKANGGWKYYSVPNPPRKWTDAGCIQYGDRSGEFIKIIPKTDNTPGGNFYYLTNSYYNHDLLLSKNVTTAMTDWKYDVIDSSLRIVPAAGTVDNLQYRFSSFEHIDYVKPSDSMLYLVYGFSDLYGYGTNNKRATFFFAKYNLNKFNTPGYVVEARKDFNFAPNPSNRDGIYRNNLSIANKGKDTVLITYYDQEAILLNRTYDGGDTWLAPDTLLKNVLIGSPTVTKIYGDSIFICAYESGTDRLLLISQLITDNVEKITYVTKNEIRGEYFASAIKDNPTGADKIFTVFSKKTEDQIFLGESNANGTWSYTALGNSGGHYASYPDVVIAGTGEPCVSFVEKKNRKLNFAYRINGNWSYDIVDYNPDQASTLGARENSLGIYNNQLHLAYYDATIGALKYATSGYNSGTWTKIILDSTSSIVGRYPNLFVATDGSVHISYADVINNTLKYAHKSVGGNWVVEAVTDTADLIIPNISSIHVNDQGTIRIAMREDKNNQLILYERYAGQNWVSTPLLTNTSTLPGKPLTLVIDTADRPWIAYNYPTLNSGTYASEVRLIHRMPNWTWAQVSVLNNIGKIGDAFSFDLVGSDFYILGKKNAYLDKGLAMLYAENGVHTDIDPNIDIEQNIQLYPNPTTDAFSFDIANPQSQTISFEVFDMNGRSCNIYASEYLPMGEYTRTFEVSSLTSGVYVCKWTVGEKAIMKKLVIVK